MQLEVDALRLDPTVVQTPWEERKPCSDPALLGCPDAEVPKVGACGHGEKCVDTCWRSVLSC